MESPAPGLGRTASSVWSGPQWASGSLCRSGPRLIEPIEQLGLGALHLLCANLVALLRMNLFTHRDLMAWFEQPFTAPPDPADAQESAQATLEFA